MDVGVLTFQWKSVAISASSWSWPPPSLGGGGGGGEVLRGGAADGKEEEEEHKSCVCDLKVDGVVCGASYRTWQGLRIHQAHSRTHGRCTLEYYCTASNRCPSCKAVFTSRRQAQYRLQRSLARNPPGYRFEFEQGSIFCPPVVVERPLSCMLCDPAVVYPDLERLEWHFQEVHLTDLVLDFGDFPDFIYQ